MFKAQKTIYFYLLDKKLLTKFENMYLPLVLPVWLKVKKNSYLMCYVDKNNIVLF